MHPVTPFAMDFDLPPGSALIGTTWTVGELQTRLSPWRDCGCSLDLLVVLAATRTAEVEGISAAGATPESRRYTAIADAELLLRGPAHPPQWPLPPLPAGVSPALISWVSLQHLGVQPTVMALGLPQSPPFPHLRVESPAEGPAACLSSGQAMALSRVRCLWQRGEQLGAALTRPLVLAECVPGGTTTAQAVLQGLGIPVQDLVSGSALQPPLALKQRLVAQGLAAADLVNPVDAQALVAAVGDPFQALAAGVPLGAMRSRQPVLLAGGSQMLAVMALALECCDPVERLQLAPLLTLGTTAWLADERLGPSPGLRPALPQVLERLQSRYGVSLLALASGLRFQASRHPQLQAYEQGHVKEGVGAGGLALLAQLRGTTRTALVNSCDQAMDALLLQGEETRDCGPAADGSLGSEL